ncbi:MAG TPA: NAD(P)-dependent oxidoreductase [Candidatus Hydrogenedentes bacterium]|nr:NAD(P)-dependent oxidoreductase [Candidatus Hydrogenedentota bacterium]HQM47932.1 NAD(P)-dependent oxidoreductase [Candidatus Hydrogenedentota bacterium]
MSDTTPLALTDRKILVTGVQGFIGIHTAAAVHRMGARLVGVDVVAQSQRADRVRESLGYPPVAVHAVDLRDAEATVQILRQMRPEMVIHCAGSIERTDESSSWNRAFEGNAALTASLVDALVGFPEPERPVLVMPGSQMEYGTAPMPWTEDRHCEPFNAYGAGKLAAAESVLGAVRRDGLRACVLRLPIVFGPGQPPSLFVPELIGKALLREAIPMTVGDQRRAFLYVDDAAGLLLESGIRAAQPAPFPPLLNAPAYPPMAILDVARMVAESLDAAGLLRVGALPRRAGELLEAWPDASLARSLGFCTRNQPLEAIRRTVAWYEANRWFLS